MSQNTSNPDDFRNPLFSIQDHVKGPVVGSIRLADLVDTWRNGGDYLKHVLKLRTLTDTKAKNKYKAEHIPSVVVGGTCTPFEVPSDSCIVDASNHLCLDCDQGGILCAPESLRSTLESLPFAEVVSRSVSGKAWLLIFHFVGSRKRAEALAANAIDAAVGFPLVSRGQSELSRRRFMTFDPDIFHNLDAEILHCEAEDPPQPEILTPADAPDLAEIKSAFAHVSPFRDAAEWRKIVWGVRASCGEEARELCQQWSSGELLDNKGHAWPEAESTEHGYDADEFDRQWDRADRSSGGSTARTLFGLAHEGGWKGAPVGGGDFDAVPVEVIDDEAPTKRRIQIDFTEAESITEYEVDWLWPEMIPKGMVSLLAGKQGLGKSFLVCDLIARLSAGEELPDGTQHAPMRVLYLAREDVAGCVIKPRLRVAKALMRNVVISTFKNVESGEMVDLSENISLIVEEHKRKPFGFIVTDTFSAFLSGGADANDQGDVREFMDKHGQLASLTGAAVLVVAHPRKSGAAGGDPMDAIAGSMQMSAAVRSGLMLTGEPDSLERSLECVKMNVGKRGASWAWKFADQNPFAPKDPPQIEWKGQQTKQEATEAKIMRACKALPGADMGDIAKHAGYKTKGAIQRQVKHLRELGLIEMTELTLTKSGEKGVADGLF